MLNEDGGILAGILLDRMRSQWTKVWTRIPDEYAARFNLIVSATSRAAALARARLAWNTRFLFETDPDWTKQHLLPRFAWSDDEATLLWAARARDHDFVGPPELFNALKAPLLEAFERPTVANETLQGLVEQLLCVALWASRDHESKFVLSAPETKHALSICPRPIRHHAAWLLMRWLSPEKDETPAFSPGDRWRKELGPLFVSIWPRDAAARDVETTKRLARMAMAAGDAFPDAVDSILEFIEPVEITPYFVELELGQEDSKRGLAAIHPKAFVRLLDGLLDVRVTKRFAEDFASALEKCVTAEPTVREMPEFRRLDAACKKLAG